MSFFKKTFSNFGRFSDQSGDGDESSAKKEKGQGFFAGSFSLNTDASVDYLENTSNFINKHHECIEFENPKAPVDLSIHNTAPNDDFKGRKLWRALLEKESMEANRSDISQESQLDHDQQLRTAWTSPRAQIPRKDSVINQKSFTMARPSDRRRAAEEDSDSIKRHRQFYQDLSKKSDFNTSDDSVFQEPKNREDVLPTPENTNAELESDGNTQELSNESTAIRITPPSIGTVNNNNDIDKNFDQVATSLHTRTFQRESSFERGSAVTSSSNVNRSPFRLQNRSKDASPSSFSLKSKSTTTCSDTGSSKQTFSSPPPKFMTENSSRLSSSTIPSKLNSMQARESFQHVLDISKQDRGAVTPSSQRAGSLVGTDRISNENSREAGVKRQLQSELEEPAAAAVMDVSDDNRRRPQREELPDREANSTPVPYQPLTTSFKQQQQQQQQQHLHQQEQLNSQPSASQNPIRSFDTKQEHHQRLRVPTSPCTSLAPSTSSNSSSSSSNNNNNSTNYSGIPSGIDERIEYLSELLVEAKKLLAANREDLLVQRIQTAEICSRLLQADPVPRFLTKLLDIKLRMKQIRLKLQEN